jgi:hypothetical protein
MDSRFRGNDDPLALERLPPGTPFLTNGTEYATIAAVTTELDTHPEGWRDRPVETPATSWRLEDRSWRLDQVELQASNLSHSISNIQHGANSDRYIGEGTADGGLEDERLHNAKGSHLRAFFLLHGAEK